MPTKPPVLIAPIEPRLLTKAEAAAYVGSSPRNYDRLRRAGKLPGFVPGTLRVDRRALDAAIDNLSKLGALTSTLAKGAEPEPDPLERWKAERDARKAREAEALRKGVEAVTKPRRGGGITTMYFHRATGLRLPNNPKSLAFKVAFERCEQEMLGLP